MLLFHALALLVLCTLSFGCHSYTNCGTCVINGCVYIQDKSKVFHCVTWQEYDLIPARRTFRTLSRCEILFKTPEQFGQNKNLLPTLISTKSSTTTTTQPLVSSTSGTISPTAQAVPTTETNPISSTTVSLIPVPSTTASPTPDFSNSLFTTPPSSTVLPYHFSSEVTSPTNTFCPNYNVTIKGPQIKSGRDTRISKKLRAQLRKFRLHKMPLADYEMRREINRVLCRLGYLFLVYKETWILGPNYVKMQIYNPVVNQTGISKLCKRYKNIKL